MTEDNHVRRRPVYQGKIVDLGLETIDLPNGEAAELEIVRHPGGAAVVAVDHQDRVCLLRQYRHAADGWLWELPAGKLEPDEPPLGTARRELSEEAGVEAERWTELGTLHSSPGVLTEIIHLYLAGGLRRAAHHHETHEVIEIHWLPFRQVLDWCLDGTVTDAKTLIGLFRAQALHGKTGRSGNG
ncbi:NUDIX hydrolase [Candidatus Thiosymbion oneisti]|uniref:NUDIX hydrolase n=1 Tax=Candidatus Thiosymbion oneisti TaxID=589554 RepID=UPI000A96FD1E|nr:NUDIX hydrolase [Candidatus Thiosymbion oneisti]